MAGWLDHDPSKLTTDDCAKVMICAYTFGCDASFSIMSAELVSRFADCFVLPSVLQDSLILPSIVKGT